MEPLEVLSVVQINFPLPIHTVNAIEDDSKDGAAPDIGNKEEGIKSSSASASRFHIDRHDLEVHFYLGRFPGHRRIHILLTLLKYKPSTGFSEKHTHPQCDTDC